MYLEELRRTKLPITCPVLRNSFLSMAKSETGLVSQENWSTNKLCGKKLRRKKWIVYWHILKDCFLSVAKQDLQKSQQTGPSVMLLVVLSQAEIVCQSPRMRWCWVQVLIHFDFTWWTWLRGYDTGTTEEWMIYWHDLRDFFLSVAKQDLQKTHPRGPFLLLLVASSPAEIVYRSPRVRWFWVKVLIQCWFCLMDLIAWLWQRHYRIVNDLCVCSERFFPVSGQRALSNISSGTMTWKSLLIDWYSLSTSGWGERKKPH